MTIHVGSVKVMFNEARRMMVRVMDASSEKKFTLELCNGNQWKGRNSTTGVWMVEGRSQCICAGSTIKLIGR